MKYKKYRLDSLQSVRRYYANLIHRYENQVGGTIDFDNEFISDSKFKNLCYALNGLSKVLEQSSIEARLDLIEEKLRDE